MLLTKFGEALNKENPLSEYPRPQFVRNSYINLNGKWKCEFTKDKKLPDKFSTDIVVPFSPEAPLSGVNRVLAPNEFLHYEKEFEIPQGFNKGRVFLHFGAVDQMSRLLITLIQRNIQRVSKNSSAAASGTVRKAVSGRLYGLKAHQQNFLKR